MSDLEQQLLDEGKRALTPSSAERDALRARIDRAIAAPTPASGFSAAHVATLLALVALGAWLAWPSAAPAPATVAAPAPPMVVIDEPIAVEEAPPAELVPEAAPPVVTEAAPSAARPSSRPAPIDTLDAELRLLSAARRALGSGDAREAIASLQAHERDYRFGVLREEREALFVRALCDVGETGEGHRRLVAFERAHPSSVALRALHESCGDD